MTLSATAAIEGSTGLRGELLEAVSQSLSRGARIRLIAQNAELCRPDVVASLAEAVPKFIRTDARVAMALADCAHLISRKLRDPESMALALRAKANLFHVSGKNRAAIRYHDLARTLFSEGGNRTQVARTLSASIQPLILLGEYDRAYAAAAEASAIFKEDGNEWRLARVELNTGNIFDRQDRFEEALVCYERAYGHLWPHRDQDPDAVAVVLHNMAGCFVCLNDFRRAVQSYEQARDFASQHALPTLVAQADYNIARLYYLRGEYSRSISQLRDVREACGANGDHYHFALCHLDLSEIYLEVNLAVEAAESAALAQTAFRRLAMRYEEGKSTSNLGVALSQLGKVDEALQEFASARSLFHQESNRIWCSLIDMYRAIACLKHDRFAEANELANTALRFFKKQKNRSTTSLCHLLLARLACNTLQLQSAARHCARALVYLRSLQSPALSCQAHSLMAHIQKALANQQSAFEHYQLAKEHLERLRSGLRGDELKISFMRDRIEIYEGLVELCLAEGPAKAREAFAYIEQAKSRSLLDLLSESAFSGAIHPEDNPAAERVRELRAELNWFQHRLEIEQLRPQDQAAKQVEQLRAESRKREREMMRLLRENPPDETGRVADRRADLALEQIQGALHPDATIVEYFQVNGQLLAAIVTRDELEIVPLGKLEGLEIVMTRLRFQMAKLRLGGEYTSVFESTLLKTTQSHLQELHRELIGPIRNRLQTSHLIFVPHGALHHLPLQALFDGETYLLDEFTVSYAPSASIYTCCHERKTKHDGTSLVFAIPDPVIPFVEDEAAAVARLLPNSELLMGERATSASLTQLSVNARFLHIATHGYFREDQPMFSGIRMGDSILSLYDLYQLKLPVELATLSGCSTGLNVVSAGDEIVGLARGLICAGAHSALLTLWDVQDRSTADFMRVFYQRLMIGRNKAEAACDAARELRKSYPHPYYWAPFVLMGKVFTE